MMEKRIIKAVEEGHNVLILGQAGTGKTHLLTKLAKLNNSCAMTATTGMAASLFPCGQTVHRFLGLMDGRYSDLELAQKIMNEPEMAHIERNIKNTELLFIDEVSMLSEKLFLQIETVCRCVRKSSVPFGGLQVVLSGDFYQLKPVANVKYNDMGKLCIEAAQFSELIPHHFVLTEVHRQTERDLIEAINLCCQGKVSDKVTQLLHRLKRPLPPGPPPTKLFALNYGVGLCIQSN
ncbi:uncharacterized protein [Ptychodera flava]|uniref:uncharacterized protein n=1 Tax=Ptychodera flava TaxID=63121 RepID=UPI00396A88F6